jgi:hypothetical protein
LEPNIIASFIPFVGKVAPALQPAPPDFVPCDPGGAGDRCRQFSGVKRRVLAVQTQPFEVSTWLTRSSAEQ